MSDSDYKGEKTHIELAGGPKKNRGCTDCLCCVLFILFLAACGGVGYYAMNYGNPSLLAVPYDPDHQPCGVGNLEDYPLIFFVSPGASTLYRTVCVKECPKEGETSLSCSPNSVVTSCSLNLSPSNADQRTLVYGTVPYGGLICLPETKQYLAQISAAVNIGMLDVAISDLESSWQAIAISGVIALLVGFIFLYLLRISAGCVVWSCIVTFIGGLVALGYLCFKEYRAYLAIESKDTADDEKLEDASSDLLTFKPEYYQYLYIICWSLAGIIFLIVCCMQTRIRLCIAVIKCSARFVSDTKSVLMVPVIFFLVTIVFIAYWIVISGYLYTCGEISDEPKTLPFAQFEYSGDTEKLAYAHIFSLLWVTAFLIAACQFVIIGACAYWYYQRGESGLTTSKSFFLFFRYHIGTVAFGSLIIALIDAVRIILAYIDRQVKQAGAGDNDVVKYFLKCMQCCLYCFERFIKFLNKNAYIQTVMTGASFCPATKEAFFLILRNPLRVSLVAGFGELFEIFGNFAIMAGTTFASYMLLTNVPYFDGKIQSPIGPCVCFAVIGYAVGNFFMSLFGTAADCIIILFCMDEEMHTNAKFIPSELQDFIEEVDK